MKYLQDIRAARDDPAVLESLHQTARRANEADEFATDMMACYRESPGNLLYAAWFYRLKPAPEEQRAQDRAVNWKLAIPLSAVAGLALWILSDPRFLSPQQVPWLFYAWAPIEAALVVTYLVLTAKRGQTRALPAVFGLAVIYAYTAWFTGKPLAELDSTSVPAQYSILMMLHLPLAAWIAVGLSLLGLRRDDTGRFAFLSRSIEVFITAGIYAAGAGVFAAITLGLFAALGVRLSEPITRLLVLGSGGTIPLLAVATVYDPHLAPAKQAFEQGLGRLISTLMRLLLPLTLLVLAVYIVFIPFNFMAPFRSRELLIVYNAMLFAIMALLIGAIPVRAGGMPAGQQRALRLGILALAILAVLVSLYALSAIVYRTLQNAITPNRLTVIGWNAINIVTLVLLLYKQLKGGEKDWIKSLHSAFSVASAAYIAWSTFLIVALPLLFR